MLTRGEDYSERGAAEFENIHRTQQIAALHRKAKRLGFQVVEGPTAEAA